jgi:hypothetical protein
VSELTSLRRQLKELQAYPFDAPEGEADRIERRIAELEQGPSSVESLLIIDPNTGSLKKGKV